GQYENPDSFEKKNKISFLENSIEYVLTLHLFDENPCGTIRFILCFMISWQLNDNFEKYELLQSWQGKDLRGVIIS
ncbi:15941_t:CDS:2, partial [Cetraspora pellucida]